MGCARWLGFLALGGCAAGVEVPSAGALAVRDLVPGYQRVGSEAFTRPLLEGSYGLVGYVDDAGGREWVAVLRHLLAECDVVDVFFLAHGNRYVANLHDVPRSELQKLRLVYNTGPGDADQAPAWLELGARTYLGHAGAANVAPLTYARFLPRWIAGASAEAAAAEANASAQAWLRDGVSGWALDQVLDHDLEAVAEATQVRVFGDGAAAIDLRR